MKGPQLKTIDATVQRTVYRASPPVLRTAPVTLTEYETMAEAIADLGDAEALRLLNWAVQIGQRQRARNAIK